MLGLFNPTVGAKKVGPLQKNSLDPLLAKASGKPIDTGSNPIVQFGQIFFSF